MEKQEEVYNNWSINESLLQSYRSIFIASQSFLIAVGAILWGNKDFPFFLFFLITVLALIIIWCLWFRVVLCRHKIVDYYKFQLGSKASKQKALKAFAECSEDEYIKKALKRKKINKLLGKKNWRRTRVKMDLLLPGIFTSIWLILIISKCDNSFLSLLLKILKIGLDFSKLLEI